MSGAIRRTITPITLLLALATLAAPGLAAAQQAKKMWRVGWVGSGPGSGRTSQFLDALREGLRELGYMEGRNLVVEARWAEPADRAADLTAELVGLRVDVIVTQGPAVYGVKKSAAATPIVFGFSGDPIVAGFIASLARPGGNLTGMTFLSLELAGKRFELLKEAVPGVARVAILANPQHPGEHLELGESQSAARRLGLAVQYHPVRVPKELEDAFVAMTRDRAEAIVAFPDALINSHGKAIAEFAAKRRIPSVSGWGQFAADGNLMTYGPNLRDSFKHLAVYVDKVLRGTKPADLPVEQPTRFELVINLKTAKALGLTIPKSILVRADQVIQ